MADQDEAGQEETTADEASTDQRLSAVESAVTEIRDMLARVVPGSHRQAEEREERRLSRGTEAEDATREAVRRELAAAREQEQREAAAAGERESVNARLSKLEERPPEPARSKAKRIATAGWSR